MIQWQSRKTHALDSPSVCRSRERVLMLCSVTVRIQHTRELDTVHVLRGHAAMPANCSWQIMLCPFTRNMC